MMCTGRLTKVSLLFMVPGRTMFAPGVMFAEIAHRFYKSDILNTKMLADMVCSNNIKMKELALDEIKRWRSSLRVKYRNVPNIRNWNGLVLKPTSRVTLLRDGTKLCLIFNRHW